MLEIILGICDKYGFEYYADCGTLLSAVRHSGFVPWDEDQLQCTLIDMILKTAGMYQAMEKLNMEKLGFTPR